MADHAPVMIWVTDPTGACSYVNERWCDFTGTPPEKNFDFGWLDSVHPDDREKAGSDFRSANAKGEAFRAEYRLRQHDGDYRWVIDSAAPRFAPDGEYLGYIGSVLDVTDEKRAEEELRRARDELDLRVRERTAALRRRCAALGRQEEVRKELLRRLVTVQEDERRRIARELHDQMGQHLTALMLGLRLAKDRRRTRTPRPEQLRQLQGHAARSAGTSTASPWNCGPTAPRRPRPAGAPWRNYAEEWSRRSGVAAEFRVTGLGEGRLPPQRRDDPLPGRPGGDDQRPEARRGRAASAVILNRPQGPRARSSSRTTAAGFDARGGRWNPTAGPGSACSG